MVLPRIPQLSCPSCRRAPSSGCNLFHVPRAPCTAAQLSRHSSPAARFLPPSAIGEIAKGHPSGTLRFMHVELASLK